MGLINRGFGKSNSLICRGFNSTLLIVVVDDEAPLVRLPTGGGLPENAWDISKLFDQDLIKTKKIKVKENSEEIEVDVLLINKEETYKIPEIKAEVEKVYKEVKVVLEKEVEIID